MSSQLAEAARRPPTSITLVVNGEPHQIDSPDSNKTLLAYLRETLCLTGTKEGCAEGDCGACTVVVTERHGNGTRSRAVNACIQLLATLHGKEVTTVEGLAGRDGSLHPVQQAMVDCHASQCGFCTPGIVMSLHALTTSTPNPTRTQVECALAGNLCRCTGYRPIVDAALQADAGGENGNCSSAWTQKDACPRGLEEAARGRVALDHPARRYWAPETLGEFADLRAVHPDAVVLAGGTDLGLTITKKRQDLPALLYIGRVAELRRIAFSKTHLEIGAAATLTDVFEPLVDHFPELAEWARRFASPPIRNVGTLGGNIGNGSPIGDSMPVLMTLGTSLVLRCGPERREIPLDEFYTGYQRNVLVPGEFIESIRVPLRVAGSRLGAYKISKRFDQDISAVCAAFSIRVDGGRVAHAKIAFGGMAAVPKRALHCEAALMGEIWSNDAVHAGMRALTQDFQPIDDMRATKGYRQLVAQNLLYKFLLETTTAGRISVVTSEV